MRAKLALLVVAAALMSSTATGAPVNGIEHVTVGANAQATKGRIIVYWRATCTGSIRHLSGATGHVAPFTKSNRRPAHEERHTEPLTDPPQVNENWFSARRRSPYRWTGVFESRTRVVKDGRTVARCRVPRTSWSATTPRARFSFTANLQYPSSEPTGSGTR